MFQEFAPLELSAPSSLTSATVFRRCYTELQPGRWKEARPARRFLTCGLPASKGL